MMFTLVLALENSQFLNSLDTQKLGKICYVVEIRLSTPFISHFVTFPVPALQHQYET